MSDYKKVLVVDDEVTNTILLKRILSKAGYSVVVAHNGKDALAMMKHDSFDVLLTDWMMPHIDGIELIRQVRETIKPIPLILMITALVSEGSRSYALESGADDFISKPIDLDDLLSRIKDGLDRRTQELPELSEPIVTRDIKVVPDFPAVVVATSTGGPPTLLNIFKHLSQTTGAAFYVVQHGPPWMLETFSQRLARETDFEVHLASNGLKTEPNNIYIAPGDKHMRIEKSNFKIQLDDGPKENFVRPAADPLFRSVAESFGEFTAALVLTGLGRDGAQGSEEIASVNGTIIVQDPETAVAPSMPSTVISRGIIHKKVELESISKVLSETIFKMNAKLKMIKKEQNK